MNKSKISLMKLYQSSSNQELYHPIFQVGKAWPSGLERRLKKYGWFSSGHTKQISNPASNHIFTSELNHHSPQSRRSRALARVLPTLNKERNRSSYKHAFTIIEVVLVLAIAGLIFLMVFVALPALQRNQRDTQRKNDVSRLMASISSYKANNRGSVPQDSEMSSFLQRYMRLNGDQFSDPSGGAYFVTNRFSSLGTPISVAKVPAGAGNAASDDGRPIIHYFAGAKCSGDTIIASASNNIAIAIVLEGGGVYCVGE